MLLNRTSILSLAVAGLVAFSVPAFAEQSDTYGEQATETMNKTAQDAAEMAPAAGSYETITSTTTTFEAEDEYDPAIESDDHPIKKSKRGRFGGHSVNE